MRERLPAPYHLPLRAPDNLAPQGNLSYPPHLRAAPCLGTVARARRGLLFQRQQMLDTMGGDPIVRRTLQAALLRGLAGAEGCAALCPQSCNQFVNI